jgi:hypothetical protein
MEKYVRIRSAFVRIYFKNALKLLEDVLFSNNAAATAVTARTFNFWCRSAMHFIDTFLTCYGAMHKRSLHYPPILSSRVNKARFEQSKS